jgi:hypothetical protein
MHAKPSKKPVLPQEGEAYLPLATDSRTLTKRYPKETVMECKHTDILYSQRQPGGPGMGKVILAQCKNCGYFSIARNSIDDLQPMSESMARIELLLRDIVDFQSRNR